MAFKLSELLNPAPTTDPPSPVRLHHQKSSSSPQEQSTFFSPIDNTAPRHSRHNSYNNYGSAQTNREVVDSSYPHEQNQHHQHRAPQRREDSGYERDFSQQQRSRGHSRTYSGPPALTNYGLPATPVEPSPPQSARPPFSPTLDQYHHPSRSPILETRSSWPRTTSPPPILAPIKVSPVIPREQSASTTPPKQIQDFRTHSSDPRPPLSPATTRRTTSNDEMDDIQYHDVKTDERANAQKPPPAIQQQPLSPHAPPTSASGPPDREKISPTIRPTTEVPAIPKDEKPLSAPTKSSAEAQDSPRTPPVDPPTPKAPVEPTLTREDSSMNPPSNASTPVPDTPVQATSANSKSTTKKRAAPKSTPASSKKGTASFVKKPQKKKRKLDTDSVDDVHSARSSVAPVSSRASKTNTRKQSSTPAARGASSSPAPDDDYDDGVELYCICRRPDSHTWMIGCDGGCEDWFHGSCVKIKQEDGDLIDKYICPNCEKEGKGVTTWKPMCRFDGCRRPARLSKKDLSKYCSDAHGREFMMGFMKKKRKRDDDSSDESSGSPGRSIYVGGSGGTLSKGQLAAVTKSAKDVGEFRRLGEGVLSPPPTLSPDDGDADVSGQPIIYNGDERKRLSEIATEKDELASRRQGLNDREKFLQLAKERAKAVMEELNMKQMCGFDSRLSWSEEEFLQWRDSSEGRKALRDEHLGPPTSDANGDVDMDDNERMGVGICQKKRCERHGTWKTYQLQDIRYEEVSIAEKMGMLKQEEKDIRERAKLRTIKESEVDREGRVEVVDDDEDSE